MPILKDLGSSDCHEAPLLTLFHSPYRVKYIQLCRYGSICGSIQHAQYLEGMCAIKDVISPNAWLIQKAHMAIKEVGTLEDDFGIWTLLLGSFGELEVSLFILCQVPAKEIVLCPLSRTKYEGYNNN